MDKLSVSFLLLFCFIITSCQDHYVVRILDDVDGYAASYPDSALSVLQSINTKHIICPSVRARLALATTIAQDRTDQLPDSDSLITIAVQYYRVFGNPFDKFRSFYYHGRILEEQKQREMAMNAYWQAVSLDIKHIPDIYLSSLYQNMGYLYADTFDKIQSPLCYRKAAYYAKRGNIIENFINAEINLASFYWAERMCDAADSCLVELSQFSNYDRYPFLIAADGLRALLMIESGKEREIVESFLDASLKDRTVPEYSIWYYFFRAYEGIGCVEKAQYALKQYKQGRSISSDGTYYNCLSDLFLLQGKPEESLEAYKRYVQISDSLDMVKFNQDTRFVEERLEHVRKEKKEQNYAWLLGVMLTVVIIMGIRRYLRGKKRDRLYSNLKAEYESLQEIAKHESEISSFARDLLGKRMVALGTFLTGDLPGSLNKGISKLENLTDDRKTLIETIGLLYAVYHPAFIEKLMNAGLSPSEIGYCCLFIIGLRTGEVGDVIHRSSIYNISSEIRYKLGLQKVGVNLSTWLRDIYAETEGE